MRRRPPIELALLAYPRWWRDRYGPELLRLDEDLVDAGRSPSMLAFEVARSGLAVRLTGAGMPLVPSLRATRSKWLLATPGIPTVIGSFALLSVMTVWWSHLGLRTGPAERIATDLWMGALGTFLVILALSLAAWRLVFDGLGARAVRGARVLRAALFLPFGVLLAEIGLSVERFSLGVHDVLGPHGVRRVGSIVENYATMVTVSDHPVLAQLLTVLAYLVGYGGLALFVVALLIGVRRLPSSLPLLAGGGVVARWMASACGVSAVLCGVSGALIVRAPFIAGEKVMPSILPWWWWPLIAAMLLLAAAEGVGARAARRSLRSARGCRASAAP